MTDQIKEGKITHVSGHLSKVSGPRVYISSECPECDTINESTLTGIPGGEYVVECKTCKQEYFLK